MHGFPVGVNAGLLAGINKGIKKGRHVEGMFACRGRALSKCGTQDFRTCLSSPTSKTFSFEGRSESRRLTLKVNFKLSPAASHRPNRGVSSSTLPFRV